MGAAGFIGLSRGLRRAAPCNPQNRRHAMYENVFEKIDRIQDVLAELRGHL
jgi:hypothetical protein